MSPTPTGRDARYIGMLGVVASLLLIAIGLFSGWRGLNAVCLVGGVMVAIPALIHLLIYGSTS